MDHFFLRPPQKLVCFSYHPSSFWRSQFWPIPKYRLWLNQQKTMACTIWATSVGWLWLIFHCVHKKHALNPWISVCVCRFGLVVLNPSDGKYRSSLSSFDHNWSQIPLKNIEKPSLGYGFKMTGMFWHQQRNRSQLVLQVWKHPLKSPSNLIGSVQKHWGHEIVQQLAEANGPGVLFARVSRCFNGLV